MQRKLLKFSMFLLVLLTFAGVFLIHNRNILKNKGDLDLITKIRSSSKNGKISLDIPMIKIDDEVVYFPEFAFYILATKKDCEKKVGKDIWELTKRGRKIKELVIVDIVDEIMKLKIITKEAKRAGYELSQSEIEEINKTAKDQLNGIDSLIKAKNYIDEELISIIYQENFLATKFFEGYSSEHDLTEEEAKAEFKRMYVRWRGKCQVKIYWENINSSSYF